MPKTDSASQLLSQKKKKNPFNLELYALQQIEDWFSFLFKKLFKKFIKKSVKIFNFKYNNSLKNN